MFVLLETLSQLFVTMIVVFAYPMGKYVFKVNHKVTRTTFIGGILVPFVSLFDYLRDFYVLKLWSM